MAAILGVISALCFVGLSITVIAALSAPRDVVGYEPPAKVFLIACVLTGVPAIVLTFFGA